MLTTATRYGVCSVAVDANCCKRHTVSPTCFSPTTEQHVSTGKKMYLEKTFSLSTPTGLCRV